MRPSINRLDGIKVIYTPVAADRFGIGLLRFAHLFNRGVLSAIKRIADILKTGLKYCVETRGEEN